MPLPSGNDNHRVVSYNLKWSILIKLTLVAICIGGWFFAYQWGKRIALETNGQLVQQNKELKTRIAAADIKQKKQLQSITLLESARQIDKLALNNVRTLVRELEQDKSTLHEELTFYRSVIAPEHAETGIRLHEFTLLQGDQPRSFQLRFVVSQISRKNDFRKGEARVNLKGKQGNKAVSLSLFELAGQNSSSLPLGFRYFQILPKKQKFFQFKLPDNFVPEQIDIVINMSSGSVRKLDKVFDWNKELATDVGKHLDLDLGREPEKKERTKAR
ncbi:MAG: hypothetical protein PUP46_00685 [Endozoicomonas sp. (ex Botrylloides leachii)]|nr:hypothetical protein [Endozoicomonas sp. (ex Botrylloides leachii)]